jgi:hypothetical protein
VRGGKRKSLPGRASGRNAPGALDKRGGTHLFAKGAVVVKLGGFVGGTVVSTIVWYLVEAIGGGFMSAFIVSTIAGGFGMYYGVKIARRYVP